MHYATAKEMEKLDALAVANGLQIRQMMELAGWHMVSLFRKLRIRNGLNLAVVVGKGNKGGDGLSAARHLTNNGWNVSVILLSRDISEDANHHLYLVRKMNIPVILYPQNKTKAEIAIAKSDVAIDALIGYHLDGPPAGLFQEIIETMSVSRKKIISYDVPSGVDATSGTCLVPCVRAHATLSLALPKRAFLGKDATQTCGEVFIADIGIPKFLYDKVHAGSRPRFDQWKDGLMPLSGTYSSTR